MHPFLNRVNVTTLMDVLLLGVLSGVTHCPAVQHVIYADTCHTLHHLLYSCKYIAPQHQILDF